jgi:hypothetical protein
MVRLSWGSMSVASLRDLDLKLSLIFEAIHAAGNHIKIDDDPRHKWLRRAMLATARSS